MLVLGEAEPAKAIARFIHEKSARSSGPSWPAAPPVDPPKPVFGHERGAYRGRCARKAFARGGALLDDVVAPAV